MCQRSSGEEKLPLSQWVGDGYWVRVGPPKMSKTWIGNPREQCSQKGTHSMSQLEEVGTVVKFMCHDCQSTTWSLVCRHISAWEWGVFSSLECSHLEPLIGETEVCFQDSVNQAIWYSWHFAGTICQPSSLSTKGILRNNDWGFHIFMF